jgi:hypothetical protein
MLRRYKPDAQAREYFRGFPDSSLARRACISTLHIFQFSLVLLSRTRNSILNAQHQNLRFGLVLAFASFMVSQCCAQEAVFNQREKKLVGGLRDRALFDLAESHCQKLLTREGLTPTDHASIAIERIRVQTSKSRTGSDREQQWKQVDQIAEQFSTTHPKNPRTILVGLQQALAHLSFAKLLQQEVAANGSVPNGRELGLEQLLAARTILNRTREMRLDTVKAQANQSLSPHMLSSDQLRTLGTNLDYQLAVVNLTSAELTDTSSESETLNRIDSLGRVLTQLTAVRAAVSESRPLWWKTWINEASCRRMLGENEAADQILKTLRTRKRPKSTDGMLLQEEAALAIASGDVKRMKSVADRASKSRYDAETEVALIQLFVAAGQIEKASRLASGVSDRHGAYWARRADIALLSGSRAAAPARTATVDSAGLQMLLEAADKAEKNGDLDAAARGYLSVAESQFSAGDRAAGLTTTVRAAMALEKQSKHDEAAAALLKPGKAYPNEELAASIHLRGCWNLSKAKSDQFEIESTVHFKQWPESETSNQARYWVASLQSGRKDYKTAFQTLMKTQTQSTLFPASVRLARSAARRQLAVLEKQDLATRSLARQLLQSWADMYWNCSDSGKPLVAVAMAELCLAWRAEDKKMSADRMNESADLQTAESNAEFQYLLAFLGQSEEKALRISKANAAPFDGRVVAQLLRLLDRMDESKQGSEIKLAIADNAITKTKDQRLKNQFLLARASALAELGKENEAQAIFQQLMASDSKNLTVLLGMARVSKGESALKLWRSIGSRTKQQTPAWFEAKYNVAKLLHESGKSAEATKMLKYIKAVPPGWEDSELKDKFERLLSESSR